MDKANAIFKQIHDTLADVVSDLDYIDLTLVQTIAGKKINHRR